MFFGGDPFEHFAQAHGGGGGGGRRGRGGGGEVDTTKLYETLGVSHLYTGQILTPSLACLLAFSCVVSCCRMRMLRFMSPQCFVEGECRYNCNQHWRRRCYYHKCWNVSLV